MKNITFGLDTFGNVSLDESGNPVSAAQVIRDVLAQGQLADELGLNNFNIGEHHRDDFAVTAPDTILAGLATTTKNIILGTGVTVLSSEDPVRVYQRFATIDALSNGRVQITAGRGSFIESFPLFGYELSDYNDLLAKARTARGASKGRTGHLVWLHEGRAIKPTGLPKDRGRQDTASSWCWRFPGVGASSSQTKHSNGTCHYWR